jgi:O-succinylbenzoate synthase
MSTAADEGEILVFDLPMRVRFRGQERRSGVLVHGPAGWGEFSPFPDYGAPTTARWLEAAREAAAVGWPAPLRDAVPVNTTVPAVGPDQAHAMVAASRCGTAKVKVAERGQTLADDVARVEAVRDALGAQGRVRIDANGAWSVDEAVTALRALDAFDLEYAEQPVASLEDMALLRRKVSVRLAADESVRTADDPLRVAGLEAADVVVLKVQPLGGVRRCLEVAEACGLPVVVSSAVETSVGIAAGVALAAALPELAFACGLGTVPLLDGDVTTDSLVPVDGMLPVRRVEPDPELCRADDEVQAYWAQRLREADHVAV